MALRDYVAKTWVNNTTPALNATNLNIWETKIDELDKNLVTRLKLKTSNEALTNSAAFQTDNELVVPLVGGKIYSVKTLLKVLGTNLGNDIKFRFTYSGTNAYVYRYVIGSGYTNVYNIDEKVCLISFNALSGEAVVGIDTTYPSNIQDDMLISCTTSGNLQLEWAQYSASAATTTVYAGSHMKVKELISY